MESGGGYEPAEVACYSGATYAERPRTFSWQGQPREVRTVQCSWLEPGRRHFRVLAEDGHVFELSYDVTGDRWYVRAL